MRFFSGAIALAFVAAGAEAQVGHLPANSPFADLESGQELTFFGGYLAAARDPLGVVPRAGPMFGLRYEKTVGGPASLLVRFAHVASERNAVDPTSVTARQLGRHKVGLTLIDANIAVNLTGQKSWHNLVPVLNLGAGIATCGCTVELDPYRFGTPFAFSFGGGVRYVPGGRFQLRVDLNDYLYQLKYPAEYFLAPSPGSAPVAPGDQAKSFWKNNLAATIGASYLFFR
ncbi:MAG TPA: hypothetical protein VNO75_12835 [Gemmatimonadaceae bacterium]|nr:hypothetical protein [Gemmatimonadaceae bacterium]